MNVISSIFPSTSDKEKSGVWFGGGWECVCRQDTQTDLENTLALQLSKS